MEITTHRHDSSLGCWTQSTWCPAHLAGLVDFFWHSEGTLTHLRERVLPNGMVELVVHIGERFRLIEGSGPEILPTAVVGGIHSGPFVIESPAYHNVLGVRLRPAGACAVLAMPMFEVSELQVELHSLVGRAASELAERCRSASSVEERFGLAAAWVSERVANSRGSSMKC